MTELRTETRRDQIRFWERSANDLHQNFYEDDFGAQQIAECLDDVANLVNMIRQLVDLPTLDD